MIYDCFRCGKAFEDEAFEDEAVDKKIEGKLMCKECAGASFLKSYELISLITSSLPPISERNRADIRLGRLSMIRKNSQGEM